MRNCIFNGHCCQPSCDQSCPTLVETSYLLERNNIDINKLVYEDDRLITTYISKDTVKDSEIATYCGICRYWKGSRLHCSVYNVKYSQYLNKLKESWNSKSESSEFEMMKIWASECKLLVISNLDFINFKDFECQTLLTLIQDRMSKNLRTIVITPQLSALVGNSPFFSKLIHLLKKAVDV